MESKAIAWQWNAASPTTTFTKKPPRAGFSAGWGGSGTAGKRLNLVQGWPIPKVVWDLFWPVVLILVGISLAAALPITLCFAPRLVLWRGLAIPEAWFNPEVNRAVDTLHQLEVPFAPVANPSNQVIRWRLLFPVLWHSFRLPAVLFLALLVLTGMIVTKLIRSTWKRV